MTSGPTVEAIRARKLLIVGVSADTKQLGAVKPGDPSTLQGFDIEIAKKIALALWPGEDPAPHLRFKVITTGQRIDQLIKPLLKQANGGSITEEGVDIVVRAFTITCARWKQIAFSEPYLMADQRLLVPQDPSLYPKGDPWRQVSTLGTLAKAIPSAKVCAPKGSTSFDPLKAYPTLVPTPAETHTDCLALMRQGLVDAIIGDDAILAGLKEQAPYAFFLPVEGGAKQPYGVGVNLAQKDFVGFINGVLETMRRDGSWKKAYADQLQNSLGSSGVIASQPALPNSSRG